MIEICVPWQNQKDIWWNETCATIMDHFGLPGDKYTTEVSVDNMKFFFKDNRDALMCQLLISDRI